MMAVLVCLHLCLYMTATALGLWTEELLRSAVAAISSYTALYLALVIFIIVVCSLPDLTTAVSLISSARLDTRTLDLCGKSAWSHSVSL